MSESLPTSNLVNLDAMESFIASDLSYPEYQRIKPLLAECRQLRAALAACQTYDYRTLADEVERLNADLASSREQLADLTKRWGAVVDDREQLIAENEELRRQLSERT